MIELRNAKEHWRWIVVPVALALFAAPLCAQESAGKPPQWKLSVAVGPAFALGKAAERWAALVNERNGGAFTVVAAYGATLAQRDPAREFVALRDGEADLAVGSSLYWSAQVSALAAVGLPWLAPGQKPLQALVSGATGEQWLAAVNETGVVALALSALDHRALATTSRDVNTPENAAGLRVRISATPFVTDFVSGLGMLPQSSPFAAAQAAFRSGALDAQEGTPASFAAARLDAVGVRRVLAWDAIAEIAIFAASAKAWQRLTDEQRSLVRDAAREVARELPAWALAENEAALAELRKHGVTVTRLTPSGRAAFAFAARGAYDRWAAVAGEEVVRAAESAVRAATP
jgi:TRAP-type C4-dicarboxylate transport system substrate-binding protein